MRAGPLRYRVTIQQLVAGSPQQNAFGEPDKTWTAVDTVWADIRPLRGQQLLTAQQINTKIAVEIDIRYSGNVTGMISEMRVVHGTTIYEVESVPPLRPARGARFTLSCSTGLTEG